MRFNQSTTATKTAAEMMVRCVTVSAFQVAFFSSLPLVLDDELVQTVLRTDEGLL